MTDLPEDVIRHARAVHDEIFGPSDYYNVGPIARAILAERERAATVAQKLYAHWNTGPYTGVSDDPPSALDAAKAIRSPAA